MKYSIPPGGIKAGRVFGYGVKFPDDLGLWDGNDTTFDLSSTQPDSLSIYCYNGDDEPHFLQALIYSDIGFSDAGLPSYEFTETSIPDGLEISKGALVLPFSSNYLYVGPREGRKEELLAAFADPSNYAGSSTPYNINTSSANKNFVSTLFVALATFTVAVTML
jgi:hypothetical protein